MSSSSETSEGVPFFYDREKLFQSLFGDFEPEPETNQAIIPQITVPFKKRSEVRLLTNNVVEEESPLMEKEETPLVEKEETPLVEKEETTKQTAMEEIKSGEGKRKKAYEVTKSGARKFVIKSYRKSEELRKKAELGKIEKEEREKGKSLIQTDDQEISTSVMKRKMKEKENNGDEIVVPIQTPFTSRKTWSRKRKEETSSFFSPKSLSIKSPERIKGKREVKKGKELAHGDNISNHENVSKKPIRFKKSENGDMKKKKELKGDNSLLPEDDHCFQDETVVQKPASSKKHKKNKEIIKGENKAIDELNGDHLMDENAALIPVICKKPRSINRRRRNPEHAQ